MLLMLSLLLSLEKELDLSGYPTYSAQEMSQISQNVVTVDGVCRTVIIIEMLELCVQVRCSICTFYRQFTMCSVVEDRVRIVLDTLWPWITE